MASNGSSVGDDARLDPAARAALLDDLIVGAIVPDYRLDRTLTLDKRQIDLGRSFYRKLVPLAASGRYSVGEQIVHEKLAGVAPDEIRAAVQDLIAGDQYRPLAERAPAVAKFDPARRYRLTSMTNRAFLSRRLMTDGEIYLQSKILGSALRLNLMEGLFTWAMHGRNSEEALRFAIDKLQGLDRQSRNALDLERHPGDSAWIAERHKKVERRLLPILLRYGILEPADQPNG